MTRPDDDWVVSASDGRVYIAGNARRPVLRRTDGSVVITAPFYGEYRVFLSQTDKPRVWAVGSDFAATTAPSPARRDITTTVLRPGTVLVASPDGELLAHNSPNTLSPREFAGCTLDQAMGWLDHGLRIASAGIAGAGRPARLLLSGGVDSALLASYLWDAGADVRALTFRTPWGDEVDGASRTAHHIGVPLDVIDVSARDLTAAISQCMQYTQSDDADIITVHLLVTVAFEIARACGADLITGLGSDLLNAGGDFGLGNVADDPAERIDEVSASGLMVTDQLTPGPRMHHPYWSSPLIHLQQRIPEQLKTAHGMEKYYLRQLAAHRLPRDTAFGTKVAIQEGSGLVAGLGSALGEDLSDVCARMRTDALADVQSHGARTEKVVLR